MPESTSLRFVQLFAAAFGLLAAAALGILLAGCGGAGDDTAADDTAGDDDEPVPGAPVFLSFGTSVSEITEDESVTFSAVLTDPDGIDDLIGGTLASEDGTRQYGAFETSGQEGSYSLALSWAMLEQTETIVFLDGASRTFVATFFDVEGHPVSRSVSIGLTCDGDAACHGACYEVCGFNYEERVSCDDACDADGMDCFEGDTDRRAFYSGPFGSNFIMLDTCAEVPPPTYGDGDDPFWEVECLCLPRG